MLVLCLYQCFRRLCCAYGRTDAKFCVSTITMGRIYKTLR